MADCYIIDAARTPRGVGKPGKGALSHFHSGRLLAKVFEAIGERNNLKSEDIDDIVIGCSTCLLYTSPSPRDRTRSRMPSSA